MPPTTPAPAAPPPIVVPEDEMLEPGEHIVTVVRKHFIGIIGLYLGAIVGVTAILFIRKVSRLSMANVEDVTAEQRGILATIFNYGTLTIQTAGTMENFIFTYCPRPNDFAHRVLEARQAYALSLEENQERR
jgi:hypothetical protein